MRKIIASRYVYSVVTSIGTLRNMYRAIKDGVCGVDDFRDLLLAMMKHATEDYGAEDTELVAEVLCYLLFEDNHASKFEEMFNGKVSDITPGDMEILAEIEDKIIGEV